MKEKIIAILKQHESFCGEDNVGDSIYGVEPTEYEKVALQILHELQINPHDLLPTPQQ